jgi:two-component system response regulator AtoC
MKKNKVLIVDDEPSFVKMVRYNLQIDNYEVESASGGDEALHKARENMPDLVFLDLKMPGMDGIQVLKQIKSQDGNIPVIMISGKSDIETAVEAMKAGAYDFITKPFEVNELLIKARNALRNKELMEEVGALKFEIEKKYQFENMIGKSPKMQKIFSEIENVLNNDVTVLIQGESGTGKELVARAVHYNGFRKKKPFVVLNCGAIPENLLESELFGYERGAFTGALERKVGKFEKADGGSIFLDEIGELPFATQVKLLRALQEREIERLGGHEKIMVDVRIITATNKDLKKEVSQKRFREDLFYRIAVFPILIPPLREHKEDIPLLIAHFLKIYNQRAGKKIDGVSERAMDILMGYSWPGNIRELENVIERAVVLVKDSMIRPEHLPRELRAVSSGKKGRGAAEILSLEKLEEKAMREAITATSGNVSQAAKKLGIGRATFYRKAKKYGII